MENKARIGSKILSIDGLKRICPNYLDILHMIEKFRTIREIDNEYFDFDNIISILGERGSGKTSTMMTLKKIIENINYPYSSSGKFISENDIKSALEKENKHNNSDHFDIVLNIINPGVIKNNDILGILIGHIDRELRKYEIEWKQMTLNEKNSFINCGKNSDSMYCSEINIESPMKKMYRNLLFKYSNVKTDYDNIINSFGYDNKIKYIDDIKDILNSDIDIIYSFKKCLSELIKFKKYINKGKNLNVEPIVHIFFDDMDLVENRILNILKDISSLLSMQNVVVYIAGDYKNILKRVQLDYIKEDGLLNTNLLNISPEKNEKYNNYKDDILLNKYKLSKDFLSKVLVLKNRIYLKKYDLQDIMKFSYEEQGIVDKNKDFENLLNQLFSKKIDKGLITIFNKNPRTMINIYSYLSELFEVIKNKDSSKSNFYQLLNKILSIMIETNENFSNYENLIKESIIFTREDVCKIEILFENLNIIDVENNIYDYIEINILMYLIVLIVKSYKRLDLVYNKELLLMNLRNSIQKIDKDIICIPNKYTIDDIIKFYGFIYEKRFNWTNIFFEKRFELYLKYIYEIIKKDNKQEKEVNYLHFVLEHINNSLDVKWIFSVSKNISEIVKYEISDGDIKYDSDFFSIDEIVTNNIKNNKILFKDIENNNLSMLFNKIREISKNKKEKFVSELINSLYYQGEEKIKEILDEKMLSNLELNKINDDDSIKEKKETTEGLDEIIEKFINRYINLDNKRIDGKELYELILNFSKNNKISLERNVVGNLFYLENLFINNEFAKKADDKFKVEELEDNLRDEKNKNEQIVLTLNFNNLKLKIDKINELLSILKNIENQVIDGRTKKSRKRITELMSEKIKSISEDISKLNFETSFSDIIEIYNKIENIYKSIYIYFKYIVTVITKDDEELNKYKEILTNMKIDLKAEFELFYNYKKSKEQINKYEYLLLIKEYFKDNNIKFKNELKEKNFFVFKYLEKIIKNLENNESLKSDYCEGNMDVYIKNVNRELEGDFFDVSLDLKNIEEEKNNKDKFNLEILNLESKKIALAELYLKINKDKFNSQNNYINIIENKELNRIKRFLDADLKKGLI